MIKITREADYGIVLMAALVQAPKQAWSAAALAKRCRLPLPMASKILKSLAQAGLLSSQRGAQGGYRLARDAAQVSVADVIEALEGPIALTECSTETLNACAYQTHCGVSDHWNRINTAIRDALQNISLQEMSRAEIAASDEQPIHFYSHTSQLSEVSVKQ